MSRNELVGEYPHRERYYHRTTITLFFLLLILFLLVFICSALSGGWPTRWSASSAACASRTSAWRRQRQRPSQLLLQLQPLPLPLRAGGMLMLLEHVLCGLVVLGAGVGWRTEMFYLLAIAMGAVMYIYIYIFMRAE